MKDCYVLLGSNIGRREEYLSEALSRLGELVGEVVRTSSIYETAAWGVENQQPFLNQVLLLKTVLSPKVVLEHALSIEAELGRERKERWGARIIDIDLLFYENIIIQSEQLTLPHPELHNRRFTLVPLMEIAPDFVHPVMGYSTMELLEFCSDRLEVRKFSSI